MRARLDSLSFHKASLFENYLPPLSARAALAAVHAKLMILFVLPPHENQPGQDFLRFLIGELKLQQGEELWCEVAHESEGALVLSKMQWIRPKRILFQFFFHMRANDRLCQVLKVSWTLALFTTACAIATLMTSPHTSIDVLQMKSDALIFNGFQISIALHECLVISRANFLFF